MILSFVWFLVLGVFSGLLSGLLGIGGGLLIVPGLAFIFSMMHLIPMSAEMHYAAGTSLAIMVITTIFSAAAHQRHGHIVWKVVRKIIPGAMLGVVVGAIIAHFLPSKILSILFSLFVLFVAIRMLMLVKPKAGRTLPGFWGMSSLSFLIGGKSGILGIGGGALIIPYLVRCNVPMKKASGTSSACSWFIAVAGTIAIIATGEGTTLTIPYSFGYIYWPAFAGVVISSSISAPIGAWLTAKLPVDILKRIFGIFLLVVAVDMFISGL